MQSKLHFACSLLIYFEKVKGMFYGMVASTDLSKLTRLHPLYLFPVCRASTMWDIWIILQCTQKTEIGDTEIFIVDCYSITIVLNLLYITNLIFK